MALLTLLAAAAFVLTRPIPNDQVRNPCRQETNVVTVDLGEVLMEHYVQRGHTATYTLQTMPLSRRVALPATCEVSGTARRPEVTVIVTR